MNWDQYPRLPRVVSMVLPPCPPCTAALYFRRCVGNGFRQPPSTHSAHVEETDNKERRQEIYQPMHFAPAPQANPDQHERNEAEGQSVRDAVAQRNHDDGEKRWHSNRRI